MKICLTTFVQGHLYQEYLPMLIYSIGKAYPEYDVKIFLHDTLRDDLRPALDMIRSTYDRFEIREHTFADCPNMNSLVARSLRWVLWDESFRDYDYLYTIDIDMFYNKETGIYSCIRCQFRGTEEEVLQGNEDVRKKYKAMYKRFDKFDFD